MEDYPQDVLELEDRFSTEEACREYLFALRWPEGFVCPGCGQGKAWRVRQCWECAQCGLQTSVTAGTILQDTRKPLRLWFRAMWYVTSQKSGVSALGLQRVLGLGSYQTAWTWLHKLRRAMVRPGRDRLTGAVEVDEIFVGGERPVKQWRQPGAKGIVVVAAEEDGTAIGRIRLCRVPDTTSASLCAAVEQSVEPGSVVHTDRLRSYMALAKRGYRHEVVPRWKRTEPHPLPRVHRIASLLKRWLLGTHQGAVRLPHLDYYLDEFSFRFNRRTSRSRGKLFYRLVQQAVAIDPAPYQQIRGGTGSDQPEPAHDQPE